MNCHNYDLNFDGFLHSFKKMLRYLCCYECTDYFLDSEDEQGYIYDIQTETFINPIVKIVPKNIPAPLAAKKIPKPVAPTPKLLAY